VEVAEDPADAALLCCAEIVTGIESKSVAASPARPIFIAPGNDTGSVICCLPREWNILSATSGI
jgi:hypothetical protein